MNRVDGGKGNSAREDNEKEEKSGESLGKGEEGRAVRVRGKERGEVRGREG